LIKVSQLVIDLAEVVEMVVDPLVVDQYGVIVLDAKVRVRATTQPAAKRLAIRPYPKELEETLTLPSGRVFLLRPVLPDLPDDAVPYVFPIWVEQPDPGYQALRSMRIPVFRWDRLWPTTSKLPGDHGVMWSHHVIQLPCHQDLRPVDLNAIVAAVKSVYRRLP
jgi:hypothetical protein